MLNPVKERLILPLLCISLVLLTACDNVLNRASPAMYQGHQAKSDDNVQCPEANLFSGMSERLLTEQGVALAPGYEVVLEQVIPNVHDTVFFDFSANDVWCFTI